MQCGSHETPVVRRLSSCFSAPHTVIVLSFMSYLLQRCNELFLQIC